MKNILTKYKIPFLFFPLLICFTGCIIFWHFTPDDTFITLQFARNLSLGNGFSFNPGSPTYGFTSPLWVIILSFFYKFIPDVLFAAKILGLLFSLAAVIFFYILTSHFKLTNSWRNWATVAWAVDPYLWRWSVSGMETSLSVLLIILSFLLYFYRNTARGSFFLGLFVSLLCLTRPEGLLFSLLVFLLLLTDYKYKRQLCWVYAIAFLLLTIPWWLYSLQTFGRFLPNTASAKGGIVFSHSLWLRSFSRYIILSVSGYFGEILSVSFFMVVIFKYLIKHLKSISTPTAFLFLWPLILLFSYTVNGISVISRYLIMVSPMFIILGFYAIYKLQEHFRTRMVLINTLLLIAVLLPKILLTSTISLVHTRKFSQGMNQCLIPAGKWLAENGPKESSVAVGDIGAIGYYSQRNIVDLGALISPEVKPLREKYSVHEIIDRLPEMPVFKVDYVIDTATDSLRLLNDSPYKGIFKPLWTGIMPSLGVADPKTVWYYTIYEVNWSN